MGKFDGYLICTDLDGTFAAGSEICGENAAYVKYFQENGGLFTVATGRLPDHLHTFRDFKPNCPIITHNGAVIYDLEAEKVLRERTLPNTIEEVINYIYQQKDRMVRDIFLNEFRETTDVHKNNAVDFSRAYFKLVLVVEDEELASNLNKELKEKFGDKFDIFLAWRFGVECLAKDTNKGWAVNQLKEILGDKVKKVICVGDSESDAYMFRYADIGYAVENASGEAKAAADRVTVAYTDGAIAQIIRDLENEMK